MMDYPDRLLPKSGYGILDIKQSVGKDVWLGRYHDPHNSSSINENGEVNTGKIMTSQLPGLSCNLMPPSECDDLRFYIVNENLKKKWDKNTTDLSVDANDFEYRENYELYKFKLDDVMGYSFNYPYGDKEYELVLSIEHVPCMANYSHCQFVLETNHPDFEPQLTELASKKGWRKFIGTHIKTFLRRKSSFC